jgi:PEP-CTERM motif
MSVPRPLLLGLALLWMVPLTPSATSATPCATGTLATYIGLGSAGCQIDDKVFFNFGYSPTGGLSSVGAGSVTVTPLDNPFDPGLGFQAPWQVGPGISGDAIINYSVAVLPGGNAIIDAELGGLGAVQAGGTVNVLEGLCLGGTFGSDLGTGCSSGNVALLNITNPPLKLGDHTSFAVALLVDVFKDIGLNGGATGSAAISGITQNFSEVAAVPEPASFLLMGSGLAAAMGMARRKWRSRQTD